MPLNRLSLRRSKSAKNHAKSATVLARRKRTFESLEPRRMLALSAGLLADLNLSTHGSSASDFVQAGDLTFFVANDAVHGRELWKSDGTIAGTAAEASDNVGYTAAQLGRRIACIDELGGLAGARVATTARPRIVRLDVAGHA